PARDIGEGRADGVGVLIADAAHAAVDRGFAVTPRLDAPVLFLVDGSAPETRPVVEHDVQRGDVVDRLAGALRGGAARVITDHAAERAVHMGSGFGTEPQSVLGQLCVQTVQHDPGLHYACAPLRIDRHQAVTVFGPIDDDRFIGALTGKAGTAAAR